MCITAVSTTKSLFLLLSITFDIGTYHILATLISAFDTDKICPLPINNTFQILYSKYLDTYPWNFIRHHHSFRTTQRACIKNGHCIFVYVTRPAKTGHVHGHKLHYSSCCSTGTEYLYSVTCIITPIKCLLDTEKCIAIA